VEVRSLRPDAKVADLSIAELGAMITSEVSRMLIKGIVASRPGEIAGVHVNSGPPGFVNEPGHANFDPSRIKPGGDVGVHVNSGPPGFVNEPGHANFDPKVFGPGAIRERATTPTVGPALAASPGNLAGVHVNSGPPGFVNEPGHANFDPSSRFGGAVTNVGNVGRLGNAGVHVNSGPPGFVNEPGHANFDPSTRFGPDNVLVTLPDGGRVTLPAQGGPRELEIRGFRITR